MLLNLPPELLDGILVYLKQNNLLRLASSSNRFKTAVNNHLHNAISEGFNDGRTTLTLRNFDPDHHHDTTYNRYKILTRHNICPEYVIHVNERFQLHWIHNTILSCAVHNTQYEYRLATPIMLVPEGGGQGKKSTMGPGGSAFKNL